MKILEEHLSPDGRFKLRVVLGNDGEVAVGFEGAAWHAHPDSLAAWLGVPRDDAVRHFVDLVTTDKLPIILSTDAGRTISPWVSDALQETLRMFGASKCVLQYWSGRAHEL